MSKQSMQALAMGNEIRLEQAAWRRAVGAMDSAEARNKLAEILERGNHSDSVGRMRLHPFLTAMKGVGRREADRIVEQALMNPARNMRLHELTNHQRVRLAITLRTRAKYIESHRRNR